MKIDYIRAFVFSLVGAFIALTITFFIISKMNEDKKQNDLLYWKVIDVFDCYEHDNSYSIKYLVKINDHFYIMSKNSEFNNTILQHDFNCKYCKDHNIAKYNGFCFSTFDGLTSELQQKINNIKAKKVKYNKK